ncbi:sigma-70 region 4 domain-containing protein [Alicyclobacillus cycloheptanicus]|uniref:sigma-70 region 4 domain-containing protein n=1 Tax=Alicyclobacillus cycloheptanicus TaxID=1457 RepID=UPI0027AB5F7D|nr:sigma-70 region 4 domain-containing protein [Alicyclobacillus cycloheptanicus]
MGRHVLNSDAFRTRSIKGFSTQEIAEILGKTSVSVRVMLHRAKKALANQLGLGEPADSFHINASKRGS